MSPSQHQLTALTSEDRRQYKRWLCRFLLVYGAVVLLAAGAIAGDLFAAIKRPVADHPDPSAQVAAER